MPAIAVVMPVFNRAETVGRAIASVLDQDFSDFEFVVVDDGSSDGTVEAVAAFRDPRITLLRQPTNRGGNAARNRGIAETTAPLIAFIDSDDAFLPHKLGFLARYYDQNPQIEALIDSFEIRYPAHMGRPDFPAINPVLTDSVAVERAIFARRAFKATPAISVRREAAIRAGLFDETLKRRQDFDFVLRLTRSARCATTDQRLWIKQWSADAISAKQSTFMEATIALCSRHPDYLRNETFRPGLARDAVRHFARLAAQGAFAVAARDAGRMRRAFGTAATIGLMREGVGEIARRGLQKARRRS